MQRTSRRRRGNTTRPQPVIAHPLFLAGYIEHLGTGTTDMIADCEAYGLRTPEFVQAEDFRTVIWRRKIITNIDEIVSRPRSSSNAGS